MAWDTCSIPAPAFVFTVATFARRTSALSGAGALGQGSCPRVSVMSCPTWRWRCSRRRTALDTSSTRWGSTCRRVYDWCGWWIPSANVRWPTGRTLPVHPPGIVPRLLILQIGALAADRHHPGLHPFPVVEIPGRDGQVARADPNGQEAVGGMAGGSGAEDGVASPDVMAHAVLVAVEDREHVVTLDGPGEGVLVVLLPEVAVGALQGVVEEHDHRLVGAELVQAPGQPLPGASVGIHVEAQAAQIVPAPGVVDAPVTPPGLLLDRGLAVHVVVADGLEDRVLEEAILAGEAVDPLELGELLQEAVVGSVAREEHAARGRDASADLGRVLRSRQLVHLLNQGAILLVHPARAEMRIAGHEEGEGGRLCRSWLSGHREGEPEPQYKERLPAFSQPFENLTPRAGSTTPAAPGAAGRAIG